MYPLYPVWSKFGAYGVDLFFLLSGFLISNLLFTEYRNSGNIRLSRFFLRRALKLYPSFYLLLAVTLVYCFFWHVPVTGRQVLGEAILTQNYIGAIWGHTWSLAVEEHFYIFLPLVLAFMMKRGAGAANPFHGIPYLFLGIAVACLTMRIVYSIEYPVYDYRAQYEPSHLRSDSLFFGVFLSYLHNFRSDILHKVMNRPWRFPVSVVSVLALAPAFFLPSDHRIVYTVGFTLIYIGFGTVLLLSLYEENQRAPNPGAAARAIARMGAYSYTLYLWHVPMAQLFSALASRFGMVNEYLLHAVYFSATIVVGVVSSKLVEIPVLKLRERLFPSPAFAESREELGCVSVA